MLAVAHRHLAVLLFAVAHHQHVRDLLQLRVADLEVDLLVALVHGGADAGRVELLLDAARVFRLPVGDRQHDRLHGRQPHRERAGVVLDQDAEEALDRAVQRAMHHQRLVRLAVLADVLQPEAARQREIELHGGKLPLAADGVHQLHVDLGPVERGFIGHHFGLDLQLVAGALQGAFGHLPLLGRAVVLAAGAAIPGGKLGVVLLEAVGGQRIDGELQAVHHFVFDLLRRAEDVRVVLREAAHAEQSVQHAGALVAVDRAELAEPHRQVAIAALPVAHRSGCGTGSSSA